MSKKDSFKKIVADFEKKVLHSKSDTYRLIEPTSLYEEDLQKYLVNLYENTYKRYEREITKLEIVTTKIIKKGGKSYAESTLKDVSELKQDDVEYIYNNLNFKEGDLLFYPDASIYTTIKTNGKGGRGSMLNSDLSYNFINKIIG